MRIEDGAMTNLSEFLLARIAEDERYAHHSRGNDDVLDGTPFGNRYRAMRVLAECEAKRRIVELHQPEEGQHPDFCGHDLRMTPCPTLRLLALPYADHPDYRDEWRP